MELTKIVKSWINTDSDIQDPPYNYDLIMNIEETSSVIAEYTPRSEDEYMIKCKIVENNETVFEVKTFVGSRDRAKRIVDNWNKNATTIYPKMLNMLLENN